MQTQSQNTPRLLALGDAAWTVEFGCDISVATHARVMGLDQQVAQQRQHNALFATVTDVVPAFASITVHFNPLATDSEALGQQLLALAHEDNAHILKGRTWHLPVCFDPAFAPDLSRLAQAKALTEDDVIQRLLATPFQVYMIGFQPGFPYMGGLPDALALPRLASPRARAPAQSLAVAGEMCAVYPWDSPGGWNLLGRTPVRLFDLQHTHQPAMLAAGDVVRWHAVTLDDYQHLLPQCQSGTIARESFLQEADAA